MYFTGVHRTGGYFLGVHLIGVHFMGVHLIYSRVSYGRILYRRAPVIPITEVNLARAPRAFEGEVMGGSSLEGAGKGRLWRKGSRKGVDRVAQRVNALLSYLSYL
jgi:hypothetical protein